MRIFTFFLALLVLACPGAAQAAETLSVTHKLGTITVPKQPKRVVVMDFGTLDTLDALGLDVALALPKSNLPSYLAKYKADGYTDVGGLKEFNLETVFAFKPDLIVISGRQQDYYKELSGIAPVLLVDNLSTDYVRTSKQSIETVGDIWDARGKVDEALARIDASIAKVRAKAAEKGLKALVLLTNDGKISVYGSGSRFGIIHDALGVPQADAGIKVGIHGQLVNYEYIAEKNPDLIFVVDRSAAVGGKADGARLLNNDLVNGTNAAKNGRIIALDPNVWYLSGGGLRSLEMMVEAVDEGLDK